MSRSFSRSSARGFSLRFATIAFCAASLVSVLALSGSARAQGLFQPPAPNLTTGTVPQGVAAADFVRSGYQSLVVTDSTNNNMKVYLATGPATFAGGVTYPTCTDPTVVVAKDFNSDGYPDIAVACTSSNAVELFLNNGAGGFGSPYVTETVTNPVAMVPGDFDGDGLLDMAVVSGTGGVTIYLDVNGNVVTKTTPLTGTLTGIVTGDFNHDGNLDLAVSDSANNNVHLLTGDGAGDFTLLNSYSVGTGTKPSGIVAADFNNDGNLDVATSNAGNNTATILLGSATGALTAQTAQATGTNPIAIVTTDVNSDGAPDVVTFDSPTATTGEVDVLLGNGHGLLQTAQASSQSFVPGTLAAVADFNRDGKPDLALTQQSTNQVSVLLNNTLPTAYPDGRSFAAANQLTNGKGNFADSVAVGDFNKDGKLDIAVSYLQDNTVQVLLNNGNNGFNASTTYSVGKQPYWVASADLNGDGYADLVTANTTDGTVSVLINNRNGTFAAAVPYTVGKQPYQVAIGDVNGDGYPDLAVTNYGANTVSVLFGSKTGTFTAQAPLTTCANPYGVAIGDFAHNGSPSVAVTCYTSSQLEVFPNNGNGTFGTPYMYTVGNTINSLTPNPASLVVGDFNRDGKLDIVVGNTTANNISFFAGNGNNTFAASVESPSLNFPDSIAAGDFNGDGILDIVGVAPNFNSVELTLGVGDGTFGSIAQRAAGQFSAVKQPWAVAVGDFNNDGQLDIVTANNFHQVNLASPAYQSRYLTEYTATPGGNPSIDLLTNASAAAVALTSSPSSPIPDTNTNVTIQATVQPAYSGATPTGSVIFENAAGTVLGTGPYTLNTGGVATYDVGQLGSGSYLFTTLYSGDSNFQPSTISGAASTITVAGTPLSLTVSPASVVYTKNFTATAIVTGTGIVGQGVPSGTVTVEAALATYNPATGILTPTGAFATIGTITLAASGNNTTGSTIITALASNNLNVGTYAVEGVYNSTNGNYTTGISSYQLLTVTGEPTTTALDCSPSLGGTPCIATVRIAGGFPPDGDTVTFTATGASPQVLPITSGKTGTYTFYNGLGPFTITATFPAQGNYLSSSASVNGFCIILGCGPDIRRGPAFTLDSFTGSGLTRTGFTGGFFVPAANSSDSNDNQNSTPNDKKNTPFSIF